MSELFSTLPFLPPAGICLIKENVLTELNKKEVGTTMYIKPARPYHARPSGTALYRQGPHAFKIYYVDIIGRDRPELYEWDASGRTRDSVREALAQFHPEGIGFVIAFPHITKIFRFAPSAETILHVRAFNTPDFSDISLEREDGYLEFACLAEALIAAAEYQFWAEAECVEDYLQCWAQWQPAAIAHPAKLGAYFAALK